MVKSRAHEVNIEQIIDYCRTLLNENCRYNLYYILDAAQDKLIYSMLTHSTVIHHCLYRKGIHFPGERLTEILASVAPYLLQLSPDDSFLATLLSRGWGKNWGIFLFSDRNMQTVYEHCSGNLLALTENGQTLHFRYFDPRILRVYLPTCTDNELTVFFGPIAAYLTEDDNGKGQILFTRKNGELYAQTATGEQWVSANKEDLDDSSAHEEIEGEPESEVLKDTGKKQIQENSFGGLSFDADNSKPDTLHSPVTFEAPVQDKDDSPFELIQPSEINYGPDKYTLSDQPILDCDARKHLCKQKCCTLIFALTEQDIREGIVKWDPVKPYRIMRNEKRYCVHLEDGRCSIYENRPAVCRRLDCRNDPRMWIDFEGLIPAE